MFIPIIFSEWRQQHRYCKKWLRAARLYLILDAEVNGYGRLLEILKSAVAGGIGIAQLRDKKGSAREILAFSHAARKVINGRIPFILNDRVDLARLAADGVHLGQEDVPLTQARKMLGQTALIGVSCQTLAQAKKAQAQRADYIGFGSIFKTLTKPGRSPQDLKILGKVAVQIKIPVFAIGGITRRNAGRVLGTGIERLAVCRDICLAEDVPKATLDWNEILNAKL